MHSRLLYARALLHAYTSLFADMSDCVADLKQHLDATLPPEWFA
jgi:hypothetical protein